MSLLASQLCLLLIAGCSSTQETGSISGVVLGQQGGLSVSANRMAPLAGQEVQILSHRKVVATVTTGKSGGFEASVISGDYTIVVLGDTGVRDNCRSAPHIARVRPNSTTRIRITCHSKIG